MTEASAGSAATAGAVSSDPAVAALASAARAAQRRFGSAEGARRRAVLRHLVDLVHEREREILTANEHDLEQARSMSLRGPLLDRLGLSAAKLAGLREGVAQLAAQDDPIGAVVRATELDEGLVLRQVRCPIGVLLVVFESRPDAVVQIGSLALRTGNAVLLKGGAEAAASNRVLVGCLCAALERAGLPPEVVALVEDRAAVAQLLLLDGLIDLVIPRGSSELVRRIQQSTRIPVLGHAEGICHLYLDWSADPEVAVRVAVDSKCDYPAACNSIETLLVHAGFLEHLPAVGAALRARGVELRADPRARARLPWARPAEESDYGREFSDLVLAVRTVDSLDEAITHLERYGSSHTEAIVARDRVARERFLREVDAASVFANASTRFADGYRYGLGAEVGVSTARLHARGPVGSEGLLTTRWLLEGEGHVVADYASRPFRHRPL